MPNFRFLHNTPTSIANTIMYALPNMHVPYPHEGVEQYICSYICSVCTLFTSSPSSTQMSQRWMLCFKRRVNVKYRITTEDRWTSQTPAMWRFLRIDGMVLERIAPVCVSRLFSIVRQRAKEGRHSCIYDYYMYTGCWINLKAY